MDDQLRKVYTHLIITSKSDTSPKRYLNSLKRNLSDGWKTSISPTLENYETFKYLLDKVCLDSPKFSDTEENKVFFGRIWLGLTDEEIYTIEIKILDGEKVVDNIGATGFIMHQFHELLKKSKHYNNFEHTFRYIGHNDAHSVVNDIRETRPFRFYAKDDETFYVLSSNENFQIRSKEVNFHPPNNIALCLSISKRCYIKSVELLNLLLDGKEQDKLDIRNSDIKTLYDYFENIQTSIIFAYTAVEAFANASIPSSFTLEKVNDKGIKEFWNKENIERWMSTTEKISEVLPIILKTEGIKEKPFWADFKNLEKSRNNLIHQKITTDDTKLDSHYLKVLVSPNAFNLINSAIKIIDYFYQYDNKHPHFPLGLGIAEYQTIVIESMHKHFRHLNYEHSDD